MKICLALLGISFSCFALGENLGDCMISGKWVQGTPLSLRWSRRGREISRTQMFRSTLEECRLLAQEKANSSEYLMDDTTIYYINQSKMLFRDHTAHQTHIEHFQRR